MLERLKAVWKDEDGPTAVEYGLMVALIAVAIILTVQALGGALNRTFSSASSSMPAAGP